MFTSFKRGLDVHKSSAATMFGCFVAGPKAMWAAPCGRSLPPSQHFITDNKEASVEKLILQHFCSLLMKLVLRIQIRKIGTPTLED